jgi:eukaryotic-like serine/threonine-protein kinase
VQESSAPAGEVVRQSPSAGSELPRGATVTIVVSEGTEQAKVPNVIGKERSQAVEALRAAGLDPEVTEQPTEVPSQIGRVTDQFPPPGSEVEPGTAASIVVGKRAAGSVEPEVE